MKPATISYCQGVGARDHRANAELFDEDEFFAFGVVGECGDDVMCAAEAFAFDVFEHAATEAFVGDLVAAHAEEVLVGFFAVLDVVAVVHAGGFLFLVARGAAM